MLPQSHSPFRVEGTWGAPGSQLPFTVPFDRGPCVCMCVRCVILGILPRYTCWNSNFAPKQQTRVFSHPTFLTLSTFSVQMSAERIHILSPWTTLCSVIQTLNYVSVYCLFICLFSKNSLHVRTWKKSIQNLELFLQSQILRPLFVNYLSRICTLFCIQPADCCIRSVENHIVPVNLNTMFDLSLSCSSYTATCDGRAGVQLSQTAAVFSLQKGRETTFSSGSTSLVHQGYGVTFGLQ